LSEASAPPTSPTAQVALEAMRHGCGLRRVAEGVLTGDKDLRVLAKSVLVYWLEGEEGSADWEEWLIPVCEALDIVVSEEDVT